MWSVVLWFLWLPVNSALGTGHLLIWFSRNAVKAGRKHLGHRESPLDKGSLNEFKSGTLMKKLFINPIPL